MEKCGVMHLRKRRLRGQESGSSYAEGNRVGVMDEL